MQDHYSPYATIASLNLWAIHGACKEQVDYAPKTKTQK